MNVDRRVNILRSVLRVAEGVWFYAYTIAKRVGQHDVLFLASGLAFNGILTLIPLMLLLAFALGVFLNSSVLGVQQLHNILNTIFPPQPFAQQIRTSVLSVISGIVTYRNSLGLFGFLVLIWTATSLFDAIRSVLHRVYFIKRTRGLITSLLHDVGFILVAFILFLATNLGIPVSTTHTITGAIVGVGATQKLSGVKWGVARRIVWAWVFTIPAAALIAALLGLGLRAFIPSF